MKARFSSQQQPVKVVQADGMAYIFICLNEQRGTESYPDMGDGRSQETYYEYDYNEIVGPETEIPVADIQAHPEVYLDYEYKPRSQSIEERVSALELEKEVLNGAVSDLGAVTSALAEQIEGGAE